MTDPSGSQREYYVCRLELAAQRDAAMKARHVGVVGGGAFYLLCNRTAEVEC